MEFREKLSEDDAFDQEWGLDTGMSAGNKER